MKFTLGWLKEHLETQASVGEIADRLTMLGLEVDEVIDRAEGLSGFVVAEIISAEKHPNADQLQVCRVDTGAGQVEVVCGAPNARAGMKGVFAGPGSYVPGIDMTLKVAKIRGVESHGMLLSEREMGLSDDHEAIVELPPDTPVGAPAAEALGLADPVFDIEVTPNRADCLGVRGIARDLAAAGLGSLKPLAVEPVPGAFESPLKVTLDFAPEAAGACPYFVGRLVRGVAGGDSPAWLKDRLLGVGLRPISALVDITNYMTIGYCRPLHVFDADKLSGDLGVRLATPGETLAALDGRTYELDGEMTVIVDDAGPVALGGVIGGERTACGPETRNVFIESAYFDPVRTASTGRKLGILSDARYRFERGVDPAFLADGMEIATRLVLETCGGEASRPVIAGAEPAWRRSIALGAGRIAELGGVEVPGAEVERILTTLGFEPEEAAHGWTVSVPPWRGDVVGEADLVEEVLRVHGYEHIPTAFLERAGPLPEPALDQDQHRRAVVRRVLAERGLVETVTFSFMASDDAELFGGTDPSIRLVNPISNDLDVMRPCILPNLIAAAGRNRDRGIADAALFEVGPQFSGDKPSDEAMAAAGIRSGRSGPRHWAQPPRPVDVFDAKADALAVLRAVGVPTDRLRLSTDAPPWYHPGRSGVFRLGPGKVLARFGDIHPGVLGKMGLDGPVVAFEVLLDNLPRAKRRKGPAKPPLALSPFQPVERDFAFIVDADVPAEAVLGAARDADRDLISEVSVFDLFAGGALGEGKKSLAITVVLQPTEGTLTDAEIEAVADKVVEGVHRATGGVLRS